MYYEKHRPPRRGPLAKHKSIAQRSARYIFTALFAATVCFALVNALAGPFIAPAIEATASSEYTRTVSEAVAGVMADGMTGQPVTLSRAPDGTITAVETDAACVNRIKSSIGLASLDALDGGCEVPVPIGSLTGLPLLAGRGPEITLRLRPEGAVTSELYSSFEQAGINQTRHTISCVVTAKMYAMLPGRDVPLELSARVLLAESIIVGRVPDSYTYVVGDQSDTISRIFDYAETGR